ncbi:MAG: MBL fold metallo-hydrolase, partial [Ottowia sp.]|nr:MBL fold metallo-hydrolase [Ottowia sp.]
MRFCSLASGSSGNATLVEASSGTTRTRVLIDAGLGLRELGRRLARIGVAVAELDALFITHEHSDHIGCAPELAARHGIPLWASLGTLRAAEGRLDPATAR